MPKTEPTKLRLARELEAAALPQMAVKARFGLYDDFESELATPCLQLAEDLAKAGTPAALALRDRHLNGEFDATPEEADAWANSAEGAAAFRDLMGGR